MANFQSALARYADSLSASRLDLPIQVRIHKFTQSKLHQTTRLSIPLFVAAGITYEQGSRFKIIRNSLAPSFRSTYDDYLQYTPLLITAGMKLSGIESRSSWGRMAVSGAFSVALVSISVNGLKYTVRKQRPDGSQRNSFPSGHTAVAFMAATVMHKEYGLTQSPLYSVGAYSIATATAFSRILNNRHWVSDVLAGAGFGILSTEMGYYLGDLIFKDKGLARRNLPAETIPIHGRPSFIELGMGYGVMGRKLMLGDDVSAISPVSAHLNIQGAYFLTPHLGLGLQISAMATPVVFDISADKELIGRPGHRIVQISSDPLGFFSVAAGPYFSFPLSGRFLLGGKIQAGSTFYPSHETTATIGKFLPDSDQATPTNKPMANKIQHEEISFIRSEAGSDLLVRTGISLTGIASRRLGLRLFLDYDYNSLSNQYRMLENLDTQKPVYSERKLNRSAFHNFTIGAAVSTFFW